MAGWFRHARAQKILRAVIAGVEAYRRADDTAPEDSAHVAGQIKASAQLAGVEGILAPIVQAITRPRPGGPWREAPKPPGS